MKNETQKNPPLDANSPGNKKVFEAYLRAREAYPDKIALQFAHFRGQMRELLEKLYNETAKSN